ncbi:MAG: family 1 extracellular solute-binding protein [Paenibacillus sp.]|nr:family 1 extracellular solute-binding protein [Paenibacillus sp.]
MGSGKAWSTKQAMVAALCFVAAMSAGCSGNGTSAGSAGSGPKTDDATKAAAEAVTAPAALTAAIDGIPFEDDLIAELTANLKSKYPHITLNVIKPGKGTTLNELIVAGSTPDIVFTYNGLVASYRQADLLYDITPLAKSHRIDLTRFDASYLNDAKIASDKDELFGLPFRINFHAMYYNKALFDKFGSPYPKDGMTWDQTFEVARKVARSDGGTQYRGLDTGSYFWMAQPLSISDIDPKTDKATVNTASWKRVFELIKSMYELPGNGKIPTSSFDQFTKQQTLAMHLDLNIMTSLNNSGVPWDAAQYPSYPEKPNTYGNGSVHMAIVTKTSKYKDQAMQVIQALTSDPFQLSMTRIGMLSPLKDPSFKAAVGTGRDELKNKNIQGILKSRPVPYPIASTYRSQAERVTVAKLNDFINGKIDVNTALKQAEEEINQMVAAQK